VDGELDQKKQCAKYAHSASRLSACPPYRDTGAICIAARYPHHAASGPLRLAAEVSREEMTWSRSSEVALDQVRAWFGMHVHAEQQPSDRKTGTQLLSH
jgi:hypothetical protein